jgi:heptosyltransferase-2
VNPNTDTSPQRVLIRSVNWLGDAVMTTPALLRLREKFPDAHIALLTPEKLKELWLHHPAVDEIITFNTGDGLLEVARKIRLYSHSFHETIENIIELGRNLLEANLLETRSSAKRALASAYPVFDVAVVFPNSSRAALEVCLARIRKRIGYARPWRNFFLTQAVAPRAGAVKMHKRSIAEIKELIEQNPESRIQNPKIPKSAHQIFEYLNLAAALGANPEPLPPQLFVAPEEVEAAKKKFGLDKTAAPVFGLNPGAEYGPAKRWPVEKFIAAAREIQQRTNCVWLLLGGKSDRPLTAQIVSAIHDSRFTIHDLSGKTSLRELMSLLKICRVLLTNDTGPMHVAAALGTPVVAPFGSTSPKLTGPGLPGDSRNRLLKSDAPCSPCFLRECPIDFRCMNGVGVERIVEAILQSI